MAGEMLVAIAEIVVLAAVLVGVGAHQAMNPLTGQQQQVHNHVPKPAVPHVQTHNAQHNGQGHHQPPHGMHTMDRNSVQNQEHIMEHLDGKIKRSEETMSEEELQFHYFKVHDYDNNDMLDGIEIISALTHHHEANPKDNSPEDGTTEDKTENAMSEEELKNAIDAILAENDLNKDGFIDYSEFVLNQRAESNTS